MNDDPELKVAKLKAKYKAHTDKAQSSGPLRPPNPDDLTEVERAILLRNIIDVLRAEFKYNGGCHEGRREEIFLHSG